MTVFFINEGIGPANSGIEHAEFSRANLFRKHRVDFKLVTSNYIQKLHDILPMFALRDTESLNMFDYFQKALSVPKRDFTPSDVDFGVDVEASLNETAMYYTATFNGHFLGRIFINPKNNVDRVEYFDIFGNLCKVSHYDSRGFESLVQFYSPDNHIEVERWLDINGIPVIEKTYALTRKGAHQATWKVNNRLFSTLDDLRGYFYNLINAEGYNMFIMDRANVSEWQLASLERPAYKVFMLHNHQSSDAQNPKAELLNDNYEWTLANANEWDCILSATPQQTRDVAERWGHPHCITVPVGIIPEIQMQAPHIPMTVRKPHSMLVTARVATEKGIDNMIRAIAIAQKEVPDITLDVYGYVDHSSDNLATKRIDEAKELLINKDAITFHGHSKDVRGLHESHQVYLIFSHMEGFNIALMEAQSAGMVGLTNDVYYGPNELVQDGVNGFIVDYMDVEGYAKRIVDLFTDDDRLQTLSDGAYKLSERYNEDNVWKAWKQVFDLYENKKDLN